MMLIDWLMMPIDVTRTHDVSFAISWHARMMVIAWGIIAPLSIVMARFFKIMPKQKWPHELDNQIWWHSHWVGLTTAFCLSIIGWGLAWTNHAPVDNSLLHRILGYSVLSLSACQFLSGLLRGSKGGPTNPNNNGSLSGDHFDMTARRILFERVHKLIGYLTLSLITTTILLGLWTTNAPHWMWIIILGWWMSLFLIFCFLQGKGRAVDTYQAIWGADPSLPGNQIKKMGIGTVRPSERRHYPDKKD